MIRIELFSSLTAILMIFSLGCSAQSEEVLQLEKRSATDLIYKTIDDVSLSMRVIYPEDLSEGQMVPAMLFFHGGGWRNGKKEQFERQANYFAHRGMICVLVEYRIESIHGTTPFDAVRDAKSAMRYVRKNSMELGIDSDKIIAAGGSAGGHLAVSTALIPTVEEENEDKSISCKPTALVLFNPVLDTSKRGFGYHRLGGEEHYKEVSPILHINENAPPTLIMVGSKDKVLPQYIAEEYRDKMKNMGRSCDLVIYAEQEHGFFNYKNGNPYFFETLKQADQFLNSLGYLEGEPSVDAFFK